MDDASGLGGLTAADPRSERRRLLEEFAQRVADEARAAPAPKPPPAATTLRQPTPRAATPTAATPAAVSATVPAATPTTNKPAAAFWILLTGAAIVGLVAFVNSQQNRTSAPVYTPPSETPAAPAVETAPAVLEAAPAEAPAAPVAEDYSYMQYWTDQELRSHSQSYAAGYAEAGAILAAREAAALAARESTAYYEAQQNIGKLVRFIRDWPSGSFVDYARTDLQQAIQGKKYSSTSNVWIRSAGTYGYRSPTYEADTLRFPDSSGSWSTTGTLSNEGVTWVEMPVNYQGGVVNIYVPQGSLTYTDPTYRPPAFPPPPPRPPPPARTLPQLTLPPATEPYRSTPVPPPAPTYVTIGSSRWADEPSTSQFQRISSDMRIRRSMSIVVDCRIGYDYQLSDCGVSSSDDLTDRQWEGALDLAALYTAPQYSADGYATQNKRVKITFEFDP